MASDAVEVQQAQQAEGQVLAEGRVEAEQQEVVALAAQAARLARPAAAPQVLGWAAGARNHPDNPDRPATGWQGAVKTPGEESDL